MINAEILARCCFKGASSFLQDRDFLVRATRYRRERWVTPDGLDDPGSITRRDRRSFRPDLRRFVLMQHHQGQSTMPRLLACYARWGLRFRSDSWFGWAEREPPGFIAEAQDVLRAGLATSPWVSADDTGARHAGKNGFCT